MRMHPSTPRPTLDDGATLAVATRVRAEPMLRAVRGDAFWPEFVRRVHEALSGSGMR
jgi:hypothetical protein